MPARFLRIATVGGPMKALACLAQCHELRHLLGSRAHGLRCTAVWQRACVFESARAWLCVCVCVCAWCLRKVGGKGGLCSARGGWQDVGLFFASSSLPYLLMGALRPERACVFLPRHRFAFLPPFVLAVAQLEYLHSAPLSWSTLPVGGGALRRPISFHVFLRPSGRLPFFLWIHSG